MFKTESKIMISYRLEGKSLGKGAFFDHYTIQRHTQHETVVTHSEKIVNGTHELQKYIHAQTFNLQFGNNENDINRNIPVIENDLTNAGLLIITGRTRESDDNGTDNHIVRYAHEKQILKKALLLGMPILGICAGSWSIYEAIGGSTKIVNDHNYGGGMPRIGAYGNITHNKQVHNIQVQPGTLLYSAMGFNGLNVKSIEVNSMHWKAIDDNNPSLKNVSFGAIAKKNPEININTRQSELMSPEEDCKESFEFNSGTPVLGVQWHPEAYDCHSDNPHNKMLIFMAKAGNAFQAKQKMLKEFKLTPKSDLIGKELSKKFQNLKI